MKVVPIQPADLPRVAAYLHAHHHNRFTAEEWEKSGIASPWGEEPPPNHGYMLLDGDRIAGVIVAMYSTRLVEGQQVVLCNLSSWHVLPGYRPHSLRLLQAALGQENVHFTDLTPTEDVQKMNLRLGFEYVETTTALIPNLPWLSSATEVIVDRDEIGRRLEGRQLQIFREHQHAIPAHHALLIRQGRSCYVVYKRERRRKLPVFASLLYVSDPDVFPDMARPFFAHLLFRHGAVATLVDSFIVDYQPALSFRLHGHRPKMVRLDGLSAEKIDALYLYSDLPALPS